MENRWISKAGIMRTARIALAVVIVTASAASGNSGPNSFQETETAPGVNGIIFATAQKAIKYFSFTDQQEKGFVSSQYKYNKAYFRECRDKDFDIKFTMGIGADGENPVKMNAVRMDSYLLNTYINTIVNYETGDIKFGFTNSTINDFMGEDMQVEMVADGSNGSGAIILSLDF